MSQSRGSRRLRRTRGFVLVFAVGGVILGGFPNNARSAPPGPQAAEPHGAEEICEAAPSLEEARLITGRDFYARANALYNEKDYLGAAAAWEQVLLLMPEKEADLRVQLAHAYHFAYQGDENPAHLRKASELFRAQLDGLAPEDATRADIETELGKVEAELEALAKAEAEAQAQREEAIRREQRRLNEQALAEAEVNHQRKLQKIYFGVGGAVTATGLGSLAAMTAFLVSGARLDSEGFNASQSTGVPDEYYSEQIARGVGLNRTAWLTGIVGGVLTAAGGSLLVFAGVRQQRVTKARRSKVAFTPTLGGVRLRF